MDAAIGQSHVKLNGTALRIWVIPRLLAANLILMWAACIASAQISEPQRPLLITLPPGIPSEKVHIDYVLGGRFGAHGDYARPIADANSYSIPTSVEGKPAKSIQMVAWAPGCETRTFNVKLRERGDDELQFECTILPMVTLTGRIHPVDLIQGKPSEVSIWYLAEWKCNFFGWADCMVPQFEVATVKPDANGFFEVELPDFSSDPIAGDAKRWGGFTGEFRVVLRETKTWNPIASLQAELKDLRTPGGRLKIMPTYPSDVVFVGETPDQGDAAPREEPLQEQSLAVLGPSRSSHSGHSSRSTQKLAPSKVVCLYDCY